MILWAHRGASAQAPENTLAAFRLAETQGAEGVELDVHLCSSGELVVIHDYDLARTAGLRSPVEETPWGVIRELDAGGWKDPRYRSERVPLLGDVLDTLGPAMQIDVEIKWTPGAIGPLETRVAREILRRGLGHRVVISSFHPMSVRAVRKAAPALRTAVIYSGGPPMPFYLRRGQGRYLSGSRVLKPHHEILTPRRVEAYHRGGLEVIPWTVDDPARARALADMGVRTVITNDPARLRAG